VTLAARRAYYQAAAAVAAVGVADEAQEQQRAFLNVTRLREEAGASARLDILKGELAVAQAESDAIEARNGEHLTREALVTATSDERFRGAALKALQDDTDELPAEAEAVALALRRRPDLASLRSQITAAHLAGDATRAARLPALVFRGQVTQQNAALGHVLDHDSQIYALGMAVNWDLTQALRGGPAVAERRAAERGVRHAASASEAEAALEVRAALSSAREARERVAVQRRAVSVAEEQARVARLAYGEGVITSVEAQDAELGLRAARLALLRARLDAAIAGAEIEHALGGPWRE
jgi:outer membrane protein TolC